MQGSLFTRDFLLEGINATEAWKSLDAKAFDDFRVALASVFAAFPTSGKPNEAHTEDDLIIPVLRALGWNQYLRQQTASKKRRDDIPDVLLFADVESKRRATAESKDSSRYRHGLIIAESKAWGLPLDRGAPDLFNQNAPSTQMLRYLTRVEIASDRAIQWGILTNGRMWRLYFQGARSRSEEFLEFDLAVLCQVPGVQPEIGSDEVGWRDQLTRAFLLIFRQSSFLPSSDDGRTFHQLALAATRDWEARVSQDLSKVVFEDVFPKLVNAIVKGDPIAPSKLDKGYLEEARRAALTLLYRFLFVLYAEDRNLLPSHDRGYDDYSLRNLRTEIQERLDRSDVFSARANTLWERIGTIFRLIDEGDSTIGLPPYNGGLFDTKEHPLLTRTKLNDAAIGPILDLLSRRRVDETRRRINYRDLSVQNLGSVYEKLLEYTVVSKNGGTEIELNPFARKGSGSYYTHEDLVRLILHRTIGPLVDERHTLFADKANELRSARGPINKRVEELHALDPANAILGLKICDPAMGSGHFLVSLVDYLADAILEAMAEAAASVDWTDPRQPYQSPLVIRIGAIRQRIRAEAEANGWKIEDTQLDDRHIVRRMILKRCIYGVDKNSMAVELAKVALWLHTFTVGAPLSFLNHHLRWGDSLFGEWVRPVEDMLAARGGMFLNPSIVKAKNAARGMLAVEELTDADIAEARKSASTFSGVEEATAPLVKFMSLVHAFRWISPTEKENRGAIQSFFDNQFGDPVAIANDEVAPRGKGAENFLKLLAEARALAAEQRFLHWEVAFPGVWTDWESNQPSGGFDAIIGNPPWDRIKLQDVEWFAARQPNIARAEKASERKKKIAALEIGDDPLWHEYKLASDRAEAAARVARTSGQYPDLARGDIDLYALFVERGLRLLSSIGIAGVLVPSGIASDLATSDFFRKVTEQKHLAALFDFWNKREDGESFFPDVYYRFKFCVLVVGGKKRTFESAICAFYLRDTMETEDYERAFPMAAADFLNVNPNTGTAPIFRNRRDANLTTEVHQRIPVLVDRRSSPVKRVWPLCYTRMLDMANDSGLFRNRDELERAGFYSVAGSRLKKGDDEYLPLYEGKMVQAFDHRAADIVIAGANIFRPGQTDQATDAKHSDPNYSPTPRYYVSKEACHWPDGLRWSLSFKDITSVTNTRTMIAALIPFCGAGHTLPILLPECSDDPEMAAAQIRNYKNFAPLICANFNSFAFDFLARQKVQGNHLTWFIVEQLPIIPPAAWTGKIGKVKVADFVRNEVLHLTFTAHDIAAFARDMNYEGPPFAWDENNRRHRRARIDALFFQLYGIDSDAAAYILDSFSIVREQDESQFGGRYITKELVIAYMRALSAGDLTSTVSL